MRGRREERRVTDKVASNGSRRGHGEMLGGQANLDCKPREEG